MSDPNIHLPNASIRRPTQEPGNWGSLRVPANAVGGDPLEFAQALDEALMQHVLEEVGPDRMGASEVHDRRRAADPGNHVHPNDLRQGHKEAGTVSGASGNGAPADVEEPGDCDGYLPPEDMLEPEMYQQAQSVHLWGPPLPPEDGMLLSPPPYGAEPPISGSFGPPPRYFGQVPPPPPPPPVARSRRFGLAVTAMVAATSVAAGTLSYGVFARDGRPATPIASAPPPLPTASASTPLPNASAPAPLPAGSAGQRAGAVPTIGGDQPILVRTAAVSLPPATDTAPAPAPAAVGPIPAAAALPPAPPASAAVPPGAVPAPAETAPSVGAATAPGAAVVAALPGKAAPVAGGETEIRITRPEATPRAEAMRPAPLPPETVAAMRGRAEQLIAIGQVTGARAILMTLAESGDSRSLFLYAGTYDPRVLKSLKAVGIQSDPERARRYYRLAAEAGVTEARSRLDGL